MISMTLFKKEWKSNWILLLIFMGVLTMYSVIIVSMFNPEAGDSLRAMAESMPEVFAAFGMLDVGTTLLEFVTGYLYGMLLIAFPAVYLIILSNRLVARYVDQGSMAYLLATPVKRRKIVTTQAVFMITTLIILAIYVTAVIVAASQVMFPGELEIEEFLRVNVGVLGLWIMFAGLCFLPSCVFNESKMSLGCATAVVVYSILIQMISQVGDKLENLKYATPITLFNVDGLIAAEPEAYLTCGIMYAAGIVLMAAGAAWFNRKNLPI